MKHLKQIALALAILTALPLVSCDHTEPPVSMTSDHLDQRYDINALKTKIEDLKDLWTYQDKAADIEAEITSLIASLDEAYALNVYAEADYYADWNNEDLKTLHQQMLEDYYVASDMISWVFVRGYKNSMYSKIFEPYVDFQNLEYYALNPLTRVMSYARSDVSASSELLDSYYETAYDNDLSVEETNLACAQLYIDTLKVYDVSEYLYDVYNRDYTAEQVSELYAVIAETLVPIMEDLDARISAIEDNYRATYHGSAYELLQEYAPKLSADVKESVDKLFAEKQYIAASGDDCYDGSYTVGLPGTQSALMYTYLDGSIYDLITVAHEFGHYHADWRSTTPVYLQTMNLDIAEAQSQCMEMLFTTFYPDILGDSAAYYEMVEIYNLVDSIISGFAIGEFEYRVMQQIDTITAEEVVELYSSIYDKVNLGRELYQISHLYEQPGYYISYGVSALPAMQLYTMIQDDRQNAIDTYGTLANISCVSGEYSFSAAMQECGFSDFFDSDSLDSVIALLEQRLQVLEESI